MIIAHYKLNDNAASVTVLDAIGVHNGTYKDGGGNINTSSGSTANSRGVGTCLDFDGDEYIQIADHADFDGTSQISVSCWAKCDNADLSGNRGLVSKYSTENDKREWQISFTADELVRVYVSENGTYDADKSWGWTGDNAVADINTWHHYVFVFNAGSCVIYVDAIPIDITEAQGNTGTVMNNDDCPILIGARFTNSATPAYEHYFDGFIDNVMLFDTTLNIDQVKALYHGGHGTEIVEVIDLDRRIQRRQ